jgi:hypothetical protein
MGRAGLERLTGPGQSGTARNARAAASDVMASPRCKSCKAPLPKRGARCRICGWAVDYDPKTSRRERELVFGIGLMVVSIVAGIVAFAVAIAYIKPLL